MVTKAVSADPGRLPLDWFRDDWLADEVYTKIERMLKRNQSAAEIAREVGCSQRAVERFRRRGRPEPETRQPPPIRAKLTPDQVVEMRQRYAAGGVTYQVLAEEYGINKRTVSHAVTGRNWGHIQ